MKPIHLHVPHRRLLLVAAAVTALAVAGLAIAGPGRSGSTSLVAASFYANTLVKSHTQTCTATNNDAITVTDATFTGTATSTDTRLAGPVSIHVKSVYDSTTSAGSLTGDLEIAGTSNPPAPGHFHAALGAVNANGNVQGFLREPRGRRALPRELQRHVLCDRRLQLLRYTGHDRCRQRFEHCGGHRRRGLRPQPAAPARR